jgi:hypothetical protein
VPVQTDKTYDADVGGTLSFRWLQPGDCGQPGAPYDFTGSTFSLEWIEYRSDEVVFETPSGDISGGPAADAPAANVAAVLTPASLAGRSGLYRLRLIEDPTGAAIVFKINGRLPVVRINPAPTGP